MALSIKGKPSYKSRIAATLFSALLFALLLTPLSAFADSYDAVEVDASQQDFMLVESNESSSTQPSSEECPPPETNSEIYDSSIKNESNSSSITKVDNETDSILYDVRLPLEESAAVVLTPADEVHAFAVYSETDNSLNFYNRVAPTQGTTWVDPLDGKKKTVTAVYTGFESDLYVWGDGKINDKTPWHFANLQNIVETIKVVDENIAPKYMANWFYEFSALTSADISNIDFRNISSFTYGGYTYPGTVSLFVKCPSLTTIYVNDAWKESGFIPSKNTDYMYGQNDSLQQIISTVPVTFAVYSAEDYSLDFYNRQTVPVAGSMFNGKAVTAVYTGFKDILYMWYRQTDEKTPWHMDRVETVAKTATVVDEGISPKYTANWFFEFANLVTVDLSKLDLSQLSDFELSGVTYTGAGGMFNPCPKLETVYVNETWNDDWFVPSANNPITRNNCPNLKRFISTVPVAFAVYDDNTKALTFHKQHIVPVAGFDFPDSAFDEALQNYRHATKVYLGIETTYWDYTDLSKRIPWNPNGDGNIYKVVTVSVVDVISPISIDSWFCRGQKITTLDIAKLDTSKVERMYYTFQDCSSLTSIDLRTFDTSSVKTMRGMFWECKKLVSVDCSSFDTRNVTDFYRMFYTYSNTLQTIYAGNWNIASTANTEEMFGACTSLVGGNKTKWTSAHASDRTYARIDVDGAPGYFTLILDPNSLKIGQIEPVIWAANGAEGVPEILLPVSNGDVTKYVKLTNNTHFTITYENNAVLNNNNGATATITILGTYPEDPDRNRVFTRNFSIVPASLEDALAELIQGDLIVLGSGAYAFTGKEIEPGVRVTLDGVEVDPQNYTITYIDNIDAGTSTVKITGGANIPGELTLTFQIAGVTMNDLNFAWLESGLVYTGYAQEPKFVLTLRVNGEIIDLSNFEIVWENNTNAGAATLKLTGTKSVSGDLSKQFSIAKANLANTTITLSSTSYVYTGSTFSPTVTVMLGNFEVSEADYVVTPSNRTDAGTATVQLSAAQSGNFITTSSNSATFDITQNSLAGANIVFTPGDASYTFTGKDITPSFSVVVDNRTLVAGTDYSVSYTSDRTNIGTATFTITGKGNYTDSISSSFSIVAPDEVPIAFAVYSADDNSLNFYKRDEIPRVGDQFNGKTISAIYIGFDKNKYAWTDTAGTKTPWHEDGIESQIRTVTVVDGGIAPICVVNWFYCFTNLEAADISKLDLSNISGLEYGGVYYPSSTHFFYECPKLTTLFVGDTWDDDWFMTTKNPNDMFTNCKSLLQIVSTVPVAFAAFDASSGALTFHKSAFDNSFGGYLVPVANHSFTGQDGIARTPSKVYTGLESKNYLWWVVGDPNNLFTPWNTDGISDQILSVKVIDEGISPLSISGWFVSCTNLVSADLHKLDTSKVWDFHAVFAYCYKLTDVDVSTLDTSNATRLRAMFDDCSALKTINLRNFTTSKVIDVSHIFYRCFSLHAIYATNWDLSNAQDTLNMFYDCNNLVGEKGTAYNKNQAHNDAYARVDGSGGPGYFTLAVDTRALSIDQILDQSWTPNGAKPTPVVRDGETILTPGVHYKVDYLNNTSTGEATIVITGIGKYQGSTSKTFNVVIADANTLTVELDQSVFTFTGNAHTPSVIVKLNGTEITENYTVAYSNNVNAGIDTATVSIACTGNISGTKIVTFTINKADISKSENNASISLANSEFTFNGKAHDPGLTLMLNGKEMDSSDYSVSYSDNVNAGNVTVTVTGKNNLEGFKNAQFTIAKANIRDAAEIDYPLSCVYSGGALTPTVTVKIGDYIVDESEYTLSYENNIDVGSQATIKVTANNINLTGFDSNTFSITQLSITGGVLTFDPSSYTYTGERIDPSFTLIVNGKTLIPDTDFSVAYSGERINAGTITATISGTGNYSGQVIGSFTIAAAEMKDADVELADYNFDYNGDAHEPLIKSITLNGEAIDPTDYSVSYINNTNAGTASVIISPANSNIIGTKTINFTINAVTLSDVLATDGVVKLDGLSIPGNTTGINKPSITYSGDKPKVDIQLGDNPLVQDKDYEVSISPNNLNVGDHEMTITGKTDSFKGEHKVTFYIAPADVEDAIIGIIPPQIFNEGAIEPKVSLTFNGKPLVEDIDYTLSYQNNTTVGEHAIVTVTGINNFDGSSHDYEFVIARGLISDTNILFENNTFTYDGTAHEPAFRLEENNKLLVADKDYTFVYENNINAGQGFIYIVGKGDFADEVRHTFTILPLAIDDPNRKATLILDQSGMIDKDTFAFNGSSIEPAVTVLFDDSIFDSANYKISYTSNTNPGGAMVTITGTGNYSGSVSAPFTIMKVPEIIEGHGQSWLIESNQQAVFRSDAVFKYFQEVRVDGVLLEHLVHYTLEEGSTIVKLMPEFLATLSPGIHTIGVQSSTGTASGTFTIAEKEKPTQSAAPSATTPTQGSHLVQANYRPTSSSNKYYTFSGEASNASRITDGSSVKGTFEPANESSMDDVAKNAYSPANTVKTTDKASSENNSTISPVWPWILVVVGVAALIVVILLLARRRKKDIS